MLCVCKTPTKIVCMVLCGYMGACVCAAQISGVALHAPTYTLVRVRTSICQHLCVASEVCVSL